MLNIEYHMNRDAQYTLCGTEGFPASNNRNASVYSRIYTHWCHDKLRFDCISIQKIYYESSDKGTKNRIPSENANGNNCRTPSLFLISHIVYPTEKKIVAFISGLSESEKGGCIFFCFSSLFRTEGESNMTAAGAAT